MQYRALVVCVIWCVQTLFSLLVKVTNEELQARWMKEQLFSSCSIEGTLKLILDEWSSMELKNKNVHFVT